jgi:glycosyltransferase involved in cell wall biosynthesis
VHGEEETISNVLFLPDWRAGNPYQARLAEALEREGFKVQFANYPQALFPICRAYWKSGRPRIVHLHWFDNWAKSALWAGSKLKFYAKLGFLAADLAIVRLAGCSVCWTVHNLIEHTSIEPIRERIVRRLLSRMSSAIFFHSRSAIEAATTSYGLDFSRKAIVAPHGSYVDDYPDNPDRAAELAKAWGLRPDHLVFLFFGNIRRYKGVERLLEGFSRLRGDSFRLILAGRVLDSIDTKWLEDWKCRDPRIVIHLGFVPDEDVAPIFSLSQILVLPYSATLSSGVVSLGLALGVPMLLSESARVYDIPGEAGAVYFRDGGLAEAMEFMTQADLSAMAAHNAELGRKLNWEAMGRKIAETYRRTQA